MARIKTSAEFNNWGKTYKAFSQALTKAGQKITEASMMELRDVAKEFLAETDSKWPHSTKMKNGAKFGGDYYHPWYRGQLHNSVAVRVASGTRTAFIEYMPPSPDAKRPQHTDKINRIYGAEWARMVAQERAPWVLLPGVQVQLIIGVPYADKVNDSGRHHGFADNLANELTNKVDEWVAGGGLSRLSVEIDPRTGQAYIRKRSKIR